MINDFFSLVVFPVYTIYQISIQTDQSNKTMYIKWTTIFILLISIIVTHENTIVDRNSEKQITDDISSSASFENEVGNCQLFLAVILEFF
jgi:hypothetical protein